MLKHPKGCVNSLVNLICQNNSKGLALCRLHGHTMLARALVHSTEASSTSESHAPPKGKLNITIPNRIPREPTSILEALAETVEYDPTGAPYHMIDDPATLPLSRMGPKLFTLSEESGRKAAENALQRWPSLFRHDSSEPPVAAFTPPILTQDDNETALKERITLNMVKDARSLYHALSDADVAISAETKLKYLDMLCRYNCKDEDYYGTVAQKYYIRLPDQDQWKTDKVVEQLFAELRDTYPQAYISMICGMCKYRNHHLAFELYQLALQENIILPIEVHNSILSGSIVVFKDFDNMREGVEKILVYLEEHGIRPNTETLNAILCQLMLLPPFTERYHYGLRIMKEMEKCGVEPSLASYVHILSMVYRTHLPRHNGLLRYILSRVSKKHHEVHDPVDTKFFRQAMAFAMHLNDVESAHKIYHMAWKGTHKQMMGTVKDQFRMHNYYLQTAIRTETMEKIMEIYSNLVPRVYIPDDVTYKALYDIIELYDGYHYVPQLYEDLQQSSQVFYEGFKLITRLLMAPHASPKLLEQFTHIADDIFMVSETFTNPRAATITAEMFTHFIKLALNKNDLPKALDWFEKYRSTAHSDRQLNEPTLLMELATRLSSEEMFEEMIGVLQILVDLHFHEVVDEFALNNELPKDISKRVEMIKAESKPRRYDYDYKYSKKSFPSAKNHKNNR